MKKKIKKDRYLKDLYLVLQVRLDWKSDKGCGGEIAGVFSTRKKALNACRDEMYCVLPIVLDKRYPHETVVNTDAFYPKIEGGQCGKS